MTINELYEKLNSPSFQDPQSGDLFYNFFVYQYPPEEEYEIRRQIKSFKENLIRPSSYVDVLTLDLFEEFCEFLHGQSFGNINPSLLNFFMANEKTMPDRIQNVLTQQATSQKFYEHIHKRIIDHISIEDDKKRPYVFVYGIGDIFPYMRTNVFLTNYEKYNKTDKYKIILFYPGHRVINSFSLFDKLNDSNTYRAILLINDHNK